MNAASGKYLRIRLSTLHVDRDKRIWYLAPMRAAKVQASLRIRAVSPEPSLLAHTSSESRGTFRQKARSLTPLNGWACAVKICDNAMLEDTNSLDGAHVVLPVYREHLCEYHFRTNKHSGGNIIIAKNKSVCNVNPCQSLEGSHI